MGVMQEGSTSAYWAASEFDLGSDPGACAVLDKSFPFTGFPFPVCQMGRLDYTSHCERFFKQQSFFSRKALLLKKPFTMTGFLSSRAFSPGKHDMGPDMGRGLALVEAGLGS